MSQKLRRAVDFHGKKEAPCFGGLSLKELEPLPKKGENRAESTEQQREVGDYSSRSSSREVRISWYQPFFLVCLF